MNENEALPFLSLGHPFRACLVRASPIFSPGASVDDRVTFSNVSIKRPTCDIAQVGDERTAQPTTM